MRERQKRARNATQALRDRYPQFASLRFDFDFTDTTPFTPAPQTTVLHPPARTYFFFPCPFTDCDGEFDLSEPVAVLARDGEPRAHGHLNCGGQRSRDQTRSQPCTLVVAYEIVPEFT